MALKHITTVWLIRQGVRLAWTMARMSEQLGGVGVGLEDRLEGIAAARDIDMRGVLEPLSAA